MKKNEGRRRNDLITLSWNLADTELETETLLYRRSCTLKHSAGLFDVRGGVTTEKMLALSVICHVMLQTPSGAVFSNISKHLHLVGMLVRALAYLRVWVGGCGCGWEGVGVGVLGRTRTCACEEREGGREFYCRL